VVPTVRAQRGQVQVEELRSRESERAIRPDAHRELRRGRVQRCVNSSCAVLPAHHAAAALRATNIALLAVGSMAAAPASVGAPAILATCRSAVEDLATGEAPREAVAHYATRDVIDPDLAVVECPRVAALPDTSSRLRPGRAAKPERKARRARRLPGKEHARTTPPRRSQYQPFGLCGSCSRRSQRRSLARAERHGT
jgi:hypothetical protein